MLRPREFVADLIDDPRFLVPFALWNIVGFVMGFTDTMMIATGESNQVAWHSLFQYICYFAPAYWIVPLIRLIFFVWLGPAISWFFAGSI